MAIAARKIANIRVVTVDPLLPRIFNRGFSTCKTRYVDNTTKTIDIIDTIQPYVCSDIITVVMAPGPASNGKANGTIPESADIEELLNLHSPCVRNSIEIINNNIPPATIKR